MGLAGPDALSALVAASVSAPVLREAINTALLFHSRDLPSVIAQAGGRAVFAAWCRQAEGVVTEAFPETVDMYRGTIGCSPVNAALGLHWSLRFDDAAYYAARYADAALTGVVVLHARVPREGIAFLASGVAHSELVPVEAPTVFEVITDKDTIADGYGRNVVWQRRMLNDGWKVIPTHGSAERIAMEAGADGYGRCGAGDHHRGIKLTLGFGGRPCSEYSSEIPSVPKSRR